MSIKTSTVLEIAKYGVQEPRQRGGSHNRKVTAEIVDYLLDLVDNKPWLTCQAMADMINEEHNVRISEKTVRRHLRDNNRSFKILRQVPQASNQPSNKARRVEFITPLVGITDDDLCRKFIFIDESGFQCTAVSKRGWATRGEDRSVIVRPRKQLITIVGAVSGFDKITMM